MYLFADSKFWWKNVCQGFYDTSSKGQSNVIHFDKTEDETHYKNAMTKMKQLYDL